MGEAVSGLSELSGWTEQAKDASNDMAAYIIAAILALGLVFVVYAIANKSDKAKEYAIAWIVALVFSILFIVT